MGAKTNCILVSIFFTVKSYAIPCNGPDIRLDDVEKSMHYVPHSTQFTGDCYSYTAARAWDAYRFSNYSKDVLEKEKNYFTNPYQGALQYSIEFKDKFKSEKDAVNAWLLNWNKNGSYPTDIGHADLVLDFYMKNKSCVTDQADHDLFSRLNGTNEEKTAFLITLISDGYKFNKLYKESFLKLNILEAMQPAARDNTATVNPLTGNVNDDSYEALKNELINKFNENLQKIKIETKAFINQKYCYSSTQGGLHINLFIDNFFKATSNTNNYFSYDTFRILKESIEKTCRTSPPVNINKKVVLAGDSTSYFPAQKYAKTIEDALNGNFNSPVQPLITSIDYSIVQNGMNYKTYRRTTPPSSIGLKELNRKSFHSQLIIGRKTENGKCKYLIRDSGAPNCQAYKGLHSDWKCDNNGYDIWIDAAKYTEAMTGMTYIQDKFLTK